MKILSRSLKTEQMNFSMESQYPCPLRWERIIGNLFNKHCEKQVCTCYFFFKEFLQVAAHETNQDRCA